MGENSQKFENWATLTPRSSTTIRLTENLTDLGNSLAVGLQRAVNSISPQCIPWPVAALSEVPFDQRSILDFGCKWPLKWQFSKKSFRINWRDTELRFVPKLGENRPLRSCRKVVWITTKKLWRRGTRPSPIFPKMGQLLPKFPEFVNPWPVYVPNLVRIGSVLPDLFRTDWFFGLISQ